MKRNSNLMQSANVTFKQYLATVRLRLRSLLVAAVVVLILLRLLRGSILLRELLVRLLRILLLVLLLRVRRVQARGVGPLRCLGGLRGVGFRERGRLRVVAVLPVARIRLGGRRRRVGVASALLALALALAFLPFRGRSLVALVLLLLGALLPAFTRRVRRGLSQPRRRGRRRGLGLLLRLRRWA